MASGGFLGGGLADGLRRLFSVYGAAPVLIIAFLLFLGIVRVRNAKSAMIPQILLRLSSIFS